MMKRKESALRLGFTFAGCYLGAGYVSGQELWQFFGAFGNWGYVGFVLAALLFTVINPLMLLTKAKAQIQRNKSLGGGLEYILSDEHLSVCLGEERADVGWNQIIRVKDNGRELLVYMTAARAYIWPKDQLGEQYARVVACLKQHIDTGKLKLK